MSSKIFEGSGYSLDLDLLTISYWYDHVFHILGIGLVYLEKQPFMTDPSTLTWRADKNEQQLETEELCC